MSNTSATILSAPPEGTQRAPARTTVLLLPGLLCDRGAWAAQLSDLADGADCRVPDYASCDSIEAMAQVALRGAPERFALVGHSMGGRVALEIVRRAPRRVLRLVLLDTGYQARAAGEAGLTEARQRQGLVDLAYRRGMRAMGQEWLRPMLHPDRLADAALIEAILAMLERQTPDTHAAQIRALLARPDATGVLGMIRCPTLLICGREDAWSPLARHETMARLIEGSRLEVIEHCGHMAPMEQPRAVSEALRRWMQA